MGYQATFTGWEDITLEDLLVAYRKAKADCFFENTFPAAIKFADYERDLLANLKKLLEYLHQDKGFSGNERLLGDFRLLPKKLSNKPKKNLPANGHVHFSNPDRTVVHLLEHNKIVPEFRVVGDFPVDTHILSALWINTVGHRFDAKLATSCYGARLRRIRDDELFSEADEKPFHISAVGSFVPYFQPYQKWRNDGLNAIRGELEQGREIIAVSLDLKSYYHFIDPMALASAVLHEELGLALSDEEQKFTRDLAKFLKHWSEGAGKFSRKVTSGIAAIPGGLVIGLTASRIISNVLLSRWDRLIKERIAPIHYGRYVDDMFLVLRDTKTINDSQQFMLYLKDRMGKKVVSQEGNANDKIWQIQQGKDFQGKTQIKLQSDKQKMFLLQGRAGLDLLDSIEKEISELSSEHRLMPSPDQLDDSTAARVLSAAGTVGESADTLRRADGLTIRRLSWSLQLRHVETLARDLPAQEWHEQREEFYQFAHNHILRPDNLFAHFTYLPRLLGFAISLNEWLQAEQIALRAYHSLQQLATAIPKGKPIAVNGVVTKAGENLWPMVKGTLTWLFIDAASRHYDPNRLFFGRRSKKEQRLAELFLKGIFDSLLEVESLLNFRFGSEDFYRKAPLVAMADLAKEPYKRILHSISAGQLMEKHQGKKESHILKLMESSQLLNTDALKGFLKSTRLSRLAAVEREKHKNESVLPYLFPTRPLTPAEISELAPECVGLPRVDGKRWQEKPSIIWAQYTQALRGVWIKPTLLATEQDGNDMPNIPRSRIYVRIGTDRKSRITIALTNLKTEDKDWGAMASNRPNLSRERYQRISELVNQAIRLKPRPDYLVFPELSIPLKWIDSVAARLNALGISLIAGTEYRHFEDSQLLSEACLVLTDNRLGYPATVKIWQPKLEPAVGEDKELTAKFGKHWAVSRLQGQRSKPIYVHNNVHFGVMVCSELQNSKARVRFQGKVDALMVLSWNQDLETFASLIESAALDVHAYTILVNNRKYGDSRVRSPAKESFVRDIARVRGGDNDFVIAATLDIDSLRAFQSRAKRWPENGDSFKPVPEGFKLNRNRRKHPPK
ncbi:RNA-directed DNA polymerase [Azoarcus sp. L1K30]|uniref:RNA-directed DNA polymerase n=1 Tax=Azoarcus sp. L1K30 TaxID=2820277 RepID=UPI001B8265AE|nr:RNA-directed DNA polymerase [Azoarcus sp. L1K30]MBR0567463.1 RNA-directed DNA polymerase [Azoarcus sp. L1K30]